MTRFGDVTLSLAVAALFVYSPVSAAFVVTEEACSDETFIGTAEECEAAANSLSISWNSCCQNSDNLPYGCLKRSDNDIIWNGKAETDLQFPISGRWAVCRAPDEVLFNAYGPFQASWGTSIGTVDIRDSMHYEFDIEIHSFPTLNSWSNILSVGDDGMPILWMDRSFNFIVGFRNGAGQNAWPSTPYGDGMLEAGNTYHLEFDWDQDWIRGTINGVVAVDEASDAHAVMEDQPVYVSYPGSWSEADVSVSNILISDSTASHHYISRGSSTSSHFDGDVVSYCQDVENNQAPYWSSKGDFGYNIGVRCCNDEDDGTVKGYSPDCGAYPATYDDAVRVCTEDNDYRLCTLDEIESDISKGTGCQFNHVYLWTSDECQSDATANAAAAVSGGAAIAEEANETTSADNGFRDWMTMVIGAVIGVVVTGAVVVFLMLMAKKRKRAAEEEETEMSKAVPEHVVPEMSTSSVAVPATTSGATVEV